MLGVFQATVGPEAIVAQVSQLPFLSSSSFFQEDPPVGVLLLHIHFPPPPFQSLITVPSAQFPEISVGKESTCNAGDPSSIPGLGRSPGEGKWQPTPVFLPGESRGQRSLVGYSPQGCKELNMTKRLKHTFT